MLQLSAPVLFSFAGANHLPSATKPILEASDPTANHCGDNIQLKAASLNLAIRFVLAWMMLHRHFYSACFPAEVPKAFIQYSLYVQQKVTVVISQKQFRWCEETWLTGIKSVQIFLVWRGYHS